MKTSHASPVLRREIKRTIDNSFQGCDERTAVVVRLAATLFQSRLDLWGPLATHYVRVVAVRLHVRTSVQKRFFLPAGSCFVPLCLVLPDFSQPVQRASRSCCFIASGAMRDIRTDDQAQLYLGATLSEDGTTHCTFLSQSPARA